MDENSNYLKPTTTSVCPNCGYCPTCGRAHGQRFEPYVPWPQPYTPIPWWAEPWTAPTWRHTEHPTTATTITVSGIDEGITFT